MFYMERYEKEKKYERTKLSINNKVLFITKKSKLIHKILFYSSYYFRSLSAVEFITR